MSAIIISSNSLSLLTGHAGLDSDPGPLEEILSVVRLGHIVRHELGEVTRVRPGQVDNNVKTKFIARDSQIIYHGFSFHPGAVTLVAEILAPKTISQIAFQCSIHGNLPDPDQNHPLMFLGCRWGA